MGLLGIGAGAYGVLVGAGGGFILTPLLIIFWKLDPVVAAGTGLKAVWINALSGSYVLLRQRRVRLDDGLRVTGPWILRFLSIVTFAIGIRMFGLGIGG